SHALMSLAGPCANLVIATLSFVTLKVLLGSSVFVPVAPSLLTLSHLVTPSDVYGPDSLLHPAGMALSIALSLNMLLFVFNLLPLPPMDGSGILQGLFPTGIGRLIDLLRANPMMSLLGLLVAWQIFPSIFQPVMSLVLGLLYAGS
ncbi:MAG TPA: M50 family metallopeptidase, partial [Candidatus Polarisedimenticolia bacterium]|nr:M50 family metallopeptidase [Candidatus Polarisedimenticolia bacterium]